MKYDVNHSLKRIRILKTGLWGVERYFDLDNPDNRAYFEQLATPGTELTLVRDSYDPDNPWRINVYSPSGIYLGRVTKLKSQTVARLMDAGFEIIAIVNDSLPHNSDTAYGMTNIINGVEDVGWDSFSRRATNYSTSNLPYGIYLVED